MRLHSITFFLPLFVPSLAQYTFVLPGFWTGLGYTNECEISCLTTVFRKRSCSLANVCNSGNCLTLENSCLCGTTSWLTAASQCIGESCGANAVYDAAAITSNECETAGVAMAISKDRIIQLGLAAVPTPTQSASGHPTAPTKTPSSPTEAPRGGTGGGRRLSTVWQVIIGVVASIVLVVAIVAVFFLWKRHKYTKHSLTRHGGSHSNLEGASSSREALATLAAAPARGSLSEEHQSHEDTVQVLPLPEAAAAATLASTFMEPPDDQTTSTLRSDEVLQPIASPKMTQNGNSSNPRTPFSNGRHIPGISELEARQAIVPPPYQLHEQEPNPYG